MTKQFFKFVIGGIIVAGLGWLGIIGLEYLAAKNKTDSEAKAVEKIKAYERQYAEDPYGGETPEETLRLFIDALKKGDTNLAAKYFVLDKQEEWRKDLSTIQEKGLLGEMVNNIKSFQKEEANQEIARYFITGPDKITSPLVLKRLQSHKWKIYEL